MPSSKKSRPVVKLTEIERDAIRYAPMGASTQALAKKYGISDAYAYSLRAEGRKLRESEVAMAEEVRPAITFDAFNAVIGELEDFCHRARQVQAKLQTLLPGVIAPPSSPISG